MATNHGVRGSSPFLPNTRLEFDTGWSSILDGFGVSPSGKAADFDSAIRRFESFHPSFDIFFSLKFGLLSQFTKDCLADDDLTFGATRRKFLFSQMESAILFQKTKHSVKFPIPNLGFGSVLGGLKAF